MIRVENLRKRIGNKDVLKDVNFILERGSFTVVVGPNGAGKTTLLKILALLTRPSSGRVLINGVAVGPETAALRRQIGVVGHNSFLYAGLTAVENLSFYGQMYGLERIPGRVVEAVRQVGLLHALHEPVRTFSRGMLQRLAIARAILHDPALLLLDEPYTGLDREAEETLNRLLQSWKEEGRTIFLITHKYADGLSLADRFMVLVKGRVAYAEAVEGLGAEDFRGLCLAGGEGA
ncbi:MAG: heme exporter protein [Clostridia bacterium]|nr:heme exporter protein [Clostridia bacterium]